MSGGYGEPQWTSASTPGAFNIPNIAPNEFTLATENPTASHSGLSQSQARAEKSSMTQTALSVLNILLCALMIFLGVSGIMLIDFGAGFSNFSELCVVIYMFVFAALLLTYEIMWWKSVKSVNKALRKNFGFLYGLRGKAGFLIFVAFLCLGLESIPNLTALMYSTGILWLSVGVLHIFVYFWKPHLVSNYKAPTAGWEDENNPV